MKKVMVFGTFDGLHPGHLDFFKQAKKYGDYLIIVVARDKNVLKIKDRLPKFTGKQRLKEVDKAIKRYSAKVILGHPNDPYFYIKQEQPDVICLGYDQSAFVDKLAKEFPEIKVVRLKPYKPEVYKSSKLNN